MQVTIYPITPLDALFGGTIKFSWSGNQAFKNRCIIKNNETNISVYDNTIETFKFEHVIDMHKAKLVNGIKYSAYITVFDKDGKESSVQQLGEPFYCLKTPSFKFENISNGQVISSSSFDFSLLYSQIDGELLDSWSIKIYSQSYSQIASSGTRYDTDILKYTFAGFTNKNEYYVRATGITVNKIPLDTGYIHLSVTYDIRDVFSLIETTNLPEIGAIQVRSNIVSSGGHPDHEVIYVNGTSVDLIDNILSYTEGFKFSGDFSFVILFSGVKPNKEICILSGGNIQSILTYRVCRHNSNDLVSNFELKVVKDEIAYIQYSNRILLPQIKDLIGICIIRKDGLYSLQIKNYGEVVRT